jgi:2-oxoglutarate dehydrogenase E1 component
LDDAPEKEAQVAITRIEQFYPFPEDEVRAELERYQGADDVLWVQEEPANMGAWRFLRPRLDTLLEELHGACEERVQYVGRPASASPATGSAKVHKREQENVVRSALGL